MPGLIELTQPNMQDAVLTLSDGRTIHVRVRSPEDYQPNPRNTNKGTERGNAAIDASMRDTGFHRGIFVADDGVVVGGNHAYESSVSNGIVTEFVEIEADGTIGVATRRTDWKTHRSKEARKAAIADNRTQQLNLDYNPDELKLELEEITFPAELFSSQEVADIMDGITREPADMEPDDPLNGMRSPKEIDCTCPECGCKFTQQA